MHKINGLTEEEVIIICQKVASDHKGKVFSCFESEDIEQQAWVIILSQISEFNKTRIKTDDVAQGLENWLNNVVSRRLKNFYRDNYSVKQRKRKTDSSDFDQKKRQSLMNPCDLDHIEEPNFVYNIDAHIEDLSLWDHIIKQLSYESWDILESILSGEKMNCYYKNKLQNEIKEIWATQEKD